jgi:hypothetical protein
MTLFSVQEAFRSGEALRLSVSFPGDRALASVTPSPALKADGHIILRLEKYSTWKMRQKEISGISTFPRPPRLGASGLLSLISYYIILLICGSSRTCKGGFETRPYSAQIFSGNWVAQNAAIFGTGDPAFPPGRPA